MSALTRAQIAAMRPGNLEASAGRMLIGLPNGGYIEFNVNGMFVRGNEKVRLHLRRLKMYIRRCRSRMSEADFRALSERLSY